MTVSPLFTKPSRFTSERKLRRVRCLTSAVARLERVAGVDDAIAIGVAEEETGVKGSVGQNLRKLVSHIAQVDRDRLGVANSGQIHRHGVAGKARTSCDAANPAGYAALPLMTLFAKVTTSV